MDTEELDANDKAALDGAYAEVMIPGGVGGTGRAI